MTNLDYAWAASPGAGSFADVRVLSVSPSEKEAKELLDTVREARESLDTVRRAGRLLDAARRCKGVQRDT